MAYTGYNALARELLGLKTQQVQEDHYEYEMSRMDALAKEGRAAQRQAQSGTSAPPPSSKEGGKGGGTQNSTSPAPINGTGNIGNYGSSNAPEYNAEENYEQENSYSGSSYNSTPNGDDSGGYDTGTSASGYGEEMAKGGPVKAGKKYIVGEGGKDEVYVQGDGDVYPLTEQQGIIPKEDGTIIPNPKLRKLARVMLNNKG